jgi:hypothetical protein
MLKTTGAASMVEKGSYSDLFNDLGDTTDIVLMIIRKLAIVEPSVTKKTLPRYACVYRIPRSGPESSYAKIIDILKQDIVGIDKMSATSSRTSDVVIRMGLIFKQGDRELRSFYFEDWAGSHQIQGISGEYQMQGSADMPEHVRSLLDRNDVFFERGNPKCPRS